MPKDSTDQSVVNGQQPPVVAPPPVDPTLNTGTTPPPPPPHGSDDVVLPPMVGADSGSAAPVGDVVMPTMETTPITTLTPKKKFAGGRVIATILGLLLLVGGVGAGIALVGQNQNISEEANSCVQDCIDGGKGTKVCECQCGIPNDRCPVGGGGDAGPTPPPGSGGEGCGSNTTSGTCGGCHTDGVSLCVWRDGECKVSGQSCLGDTDDPVSCTTINGQRYNEGQGVCTTIAPSGLQNGNYCTCIDADGAGAIGNDTGTWRCEVNFNQCTPETDDPRVIDSIAIDDCPSSVTLSGLCVQGGTQYSYSHCPGQTQEEAAANGCQENPTVNNCFSATACGTQQIDMFVGGEACFYSVYIPCSSENPPGDEPTPAPITAQCQNVQAYSETFTLLTQAQLAALRPTDEVNFCVAGVATGGSFDRARFTINGVLQPETTTVRPSSTDFCQLYTIPAGTTTFNVTAEIHHVTLGWK